ncbi:MAG: TlpA family protein disulfide reductase [Chlamydiae bacterium]|nr:TlpA family protein disulfide reductase [Chlamydiota bacterium]MBI3266322.1 TlpA family protein disulfide reductase [Chlamydiota bacterium]
MKRTQMLFLGVMTLCLAVSAFPKEEKAADFTLKDLEGKPFKFSEATAGKVVILDFWATWCPPCREEIPHFNELQEKYGPQGLQIVGVSLDRRGARDVKPFVKEFKVNYKMLVGDYSKVIEDYGGVVGIPTTFVIDRKGNIISKYIGYVEKEEFESQVKKLF